MRGSYFRGGAAVVALALVACGMPVVGDDSTGPAALRLGSDRWPPFTDDPGNGRLALDLVHEALERAGIQATTRIVEWTDVTAGLQDGSLDGSAAMWRDDEREQYLVFSEPYLENRLVLVGGKGNAVGARRLFELTGKRVAVVAQYAYGVTVDRAPGTVFVEGSSDQDNLRKLLAGEVDYMLVDELLIRYLAEHQGQQVEQLLEIGDVPLIRRTLHLALRREVPEAREIVERFDDQIRRMLADGTYNAVLQLDWIRADVDGDGTLELVPRDTHAGASAPLTGYDVLSSIARENPVKAADRYWIDGRVYQDWDSVPERYKTPPPKVEKPPPALLRF